MMLTHDLVAAQSIEVEHVANCELASGAAALRMVRRRRRRQLLARLVGVNPVPPPAVRQVSDGRELLARTFARLPYRARVAASMVDGCGIPLAEVAGELRYSSARLERSLQLAREQLAGSVGLRPSIGARVDGTLGAALRGLRPTVHAGHVIESEAAPLPVGTRSGRGQLGTLALVGTRSQPSLQMAVANTKRLAP